MITVNKVDNEIITKCDECGEEITQPTTNYHENAVALKEEGWVFRKVGGEWYHFCSESCFEAFKAKRR